MPPSSNNFWSQPVDQQALTLTHAIALQESGNGGKPNYGAVGDAGTSKGAYQWQPGNYESAAKAAGLDPNDFSPANQDKVAYYQVKKYKDQGLDPGQIASTWNSGSPNNWQNHSGDVTINGKTIHYDTPAYVNGVKAHYQQLMGTSGQTGPLATPPTVGTTQPNAAPQIPGFAPPQAPVTNAPQPTQVDNLANGGVPSVGSTVGGGIKAVGNFLFPVVGDIYHDLKGDSTKTGLQQLGDTALSALPFIPGLGEVGEGARAVEGAGAAAKILASPVARGAVTGYGAGVASNLSQGEGIGQSLMPNINTVAGTIAGGATPGLLKAVSGIAEKASGISPQIKNELTSLGTKADPNDAKLYDTYINATKQHSADIRSKGPLTIAADELDKAASTISALTKAAGKAVGAAKNGADATDFVHNQEISDNFIKGVADRFGLKLTPTASEEASHGGLPVIDFTGEGGKPVSYDISPIQGSFREVDPSVASRVTKIASQLAKLPDSNVKQANEIISNLYDLVDYTKADQYGKVNDPLEGLIKSTAHDVNDAIRTSSPEIAKANDAFSALKDMQGEISTMAGKNLQKGELLMRRIFSGDKSGDVNDLFAKIKEYTGVDLVKHAVLAKHAIESVGSTADKTLLEQIIEGAAQGKGGIISGIAGLAKGAARKTFANPEKIGRQMVSGKTGSTAKSGLVKAAIEASRGVSPLVNLVR